LKSFYAEGRPLPISFAHAALKEATDPFAIVGYAPANAEHVFTDEYGLRVRAILDVETNPIAQQVHLLAKRGSVSGASVAYFVPPGGEERQRDGSTLITKMEILEAGPCLDPANPDAYIVGVKAGRRHSQATKASIRSAIATLLELLDDSEDVPTETATKDNAEEPVTANADDPNAWLRTALADAETWSSAHGIEPRP
jgi:hypothetical protein